MFLNWKIITIIWAIIILILTLTPGSNLPATGFLNIRNSDKIGHFFIFAVFAYLLTKALTNDGSEKKFHNSITFSFLTALIFGIAIEFIQIVIPGRGFDLLDILADISGVALGLGVFYLKDKNPDY